MFNEPEYHLVDYNGIKQKDIQLLFDLINEKNIKLVIDDESPLMFNEKNVRYMLNKSQTQKAHGKLILSFVKDDSNQK